MRPEMNSPWGKRKRPSVKWKKGAEGAKQSFRDECDINNIVDRYQRSGVLPESDLEPIYVDARDYPDFQTIAYARAGLESHFEQLAPEEREKYDSALDWYEYQLNPIVDSEASQAVSEGAAKQPSLSKETAEVKSEAESTVPS